MMSDHWFKPKRYGYGATPTNLKGWALTFAYVLFVIGIAYTHIIVPATEGRGPTTMNLALFITLAAFATVLLMIIARTKTDGQWRWRWGEE